MKTAILAALLLTLFACTSPEKTLAKLHRENPELFDTIRVIDTAVFFLEAQTVETAFVEVPGDTVVIDRERIRVRYVNLPGDTVWIEATAKDTTVKQPVVITKYAPAIVREVRFTPWWVYVLVGILAVAVLMLSANAIFKP